MPILLDYDFNAYDAKYRRKGNFEFVIPCEGSVGWCSLTSLAS